MARTTPKSTPKRRRGAPMAAVAPAPGLDYALQRILRPDAGQNWMGWAAKDYTPEMIELTLRSAMAGDHIRQWELFYLMEDTWPRLAKAVAELKRAVAQLEIEVEPWAEDDEAATPEAAERAKLVSRAVWSMRPRPEEAGNGFTATMTDILDAWAKALTVLEIEWEQRAAGNGGTIIAPAATHWVHPSHYGLRDGRLMLRTHEKAGFEDFPPHKFILAACRARTGPLLGAALLRPLAWWWCAANFSASWLLNLAQIFGLPIRWATYTPGSDPVLVNKICAMLEQMGSTAWAAFPVGTQLELKEPAKGGGQWPQDSLLDRADRQCDLLLLGQTLTTDVGQSGSRSLGDVHKSVRDEIRDAAASWMCSVLNEQLVPAIIELNYGDQLMLPEFCAEPAEREDLAADAERITKLAAGGLPIPRAWVYRQQGIPVPLAGEEVMSGGGIGGPAPSGPQPPSTPAALEQTPPMAPAAAAPAVAAKSSGITPDGASDPAAAVARAKSAALATAYRGAMAPIRKLVMDSTSSSDLEAKLRDYYPDWAESKIASIVEEAFQIMAVLGATADRP